MICGKGGRGGEGEEWIRELEVTSIAMSGTLLDSRLWVTDQSCLYAAVGPI